ncbi:MAG: ABC transporter [Symploca sp. SIO2C1]|nr:ABC transporter [Symploca sp. SIO2C1]
MGIGARVVSGSWSPLALGLLIAGMVLIGLWLLFLGSFAPGFWGRRSTQVGTNAFVATLSVLVILGLFNFLAVRSGVRVDLTENQLFTLSPLSQRVVQNLEQPLKVWVFNPNPNQADRRLLENYRQYGSNLEFKFIDPQKELGLARKFNVQSLGEVYLEYGSERQLLQTLSEIEPLSEIKLTNGIAKLTSDRTDTVYFLQGHGETPLEPGEGGLLQAANALKEKNFTVETFNLIQESQVPEDASVVVIASPKEPLFEAEVQALSAYLSQGGSLLVMLNPDINPGLDSLLADWGVGLDNRIVIDPSGQVTGFGLATSIVNNYGAHPITQDFAGQYSLYPLARSVETIPVEGIERTSLVITNEETWAESEPETQPLDFNPESDSQGPLDLGVALSRKATDSDFISEKPKAEEEKSESSEASPKPDDEEDAEEDSEASPKPDDEEDAEEDSEASAKPDDEEDAEEEDAEEETTDKEQSEPIIDEDSEASSKTSDEENAQEKDAESRLVVFGNSDFATNGWFEGQINSDVFLNSVSWLSNQEEEAFSISPKEQQNRRVNLTQKQTAALAWSALLFVPLFGFTTAGVMWWQRR